jgi:hypothetical protein
MKINENHTEKSSFGDYYPQLASLEKTIPIPNNGIQIIAPNKIP